MIHVHWKASGALLCISDDDPGKINSNEQNIGNKLQAMLSEWLKTPSLQPTWESLVDAVEYVHRGLAETISGITDSQMVNI